MGYSMDDIYNIWDEGLPKHWVLTVRKCSCGQTLWWDNRTKTFHCTRASCPYYKSHLKERNISEEIRNKIIEFGEFLTIPDISKRLKVPISDIITVLEEEEK